MNGPFYRSDAQGLTLVLKVQPKSSRDAIEGAVETPDGPALKVAVSAPPDKGKANARVVELLAQAFKVAKSQVAVTSGETNRRKTVHITGALPALLAIAQEWMPK